MKAKIEELKRSRELRKEGKSLREISEILGVSKGSVSAWVRDVEMPEDKKIFLLEKARLSSKSNPLGILNRERYKILRQSYQDEGRALAKLKEPDFLAGCMLYWAEGSKDKNCLTLTNSDPNMLKYFALFLQKYFKIKYEDISIRCHYYTSENLTNNDVEKFWIKVLGFPTSCFRKTTVNKIIRTSCKKRQERTKYGVAKIIVCDTRILQMIYGAIQEIANFKNEEWIH